MNWFNFYGLAAVIILMLPNIFCMIFDKTAFENKINNKALQVFEQIGRFGCMILMVFNIPYTYLGFWLNNALLIYLIFGGVLLALYLAGWIIFRKNKGKAKALYLSILPTILFLFCGIMLCYFPLIVFAIIFGICHITISYKNVL